MTMMWLRYLIYRHRYIPAGKRGMTKVIGKLPYQAWRIQYANLNFDRLHKAKRRKYDLHSTQEWDELTIWRVLSRLPTWKMRWKKKDRKWVHKPHAGHLSPELERWLPGNYWSPGGRAVVLQQRFGRQRSVRYMHSRSIAKHRLAIEACVERAHAYARVSKPLKKRSK